jgi:hypothetical protein
MGQCPAAFAVPVPPALGFTDAGLHPGRALC